jgi:hypothetical protein
MGIVSRKGTRPFSSSSEPAPPTHAEETMRAGPGHAGGIPHRLRYARWVDKNAQAHPRWPGMVAGLVGMCVWVKVLRLGG